MCRPCWIICILIIIHTNRKPYKWVIFVPNIKEAKFLSWFLVHPPIHRLGHRSPYALDVIPVYYTNSNNISNPIFDNITNHAFKRGLVGVSLKVNLIHVLKSCRIMQYLLIIIWEHLNSFINFFGYEKTYRELKYLYFDTYYNPRNLYILGVMIILRWLVTIDKNLESFFRSKMFFSFLVEEYELLIYKKVIVFSMIFEDG